MMMRRSAMIVLLLSVLTGCAWVKPVQPWVKPYERQHIADPIMSFDRDPVANAYLLHVRDAREGASGADGGAGGGCGCN